MADKTPAQFITYLISKDLPPAKNKFIFRSVDGNWAQYPDRAQTFTLEAGIAELFTLRNHARINKLGIGYKLLKSTTILNDVRIDVFDGQVDDA